MCATTAPALIKLQVQCWIFHNSTVLHFCSFCTLRYFIKATRELGTSTAIQLLGLKDFQLGIQTLEL